MSLLLLILLTIACLPIDWPASPFGLGRTESAALTGVVVAGLLLAARIFAAVTIRHLVDHKYERDAISRAHGLRRLLYFFLNLAGLGIVLLGCGWGWTVRETLTINDFYLPGAELIILAPYLIALIGSWAIFYDAERALYISSPNSATRREFWSRRGYVFFLFRHHVLMVFIPVGLMIAQLGVLRVEPGLLESAWAKVVAFAGLFVFILMVPSLVPVVLGLRRMPPGRIRDRLTDAATRLGVRYRNLYIWDTRGNLATAMVTGLIPRFRHIVFTDLLLTSLSDDEIEAVFGHEVGHVRHGHLPYYAAFLLLSLLTLGAVYRGVETWAGMEFFQKDELLVLTVLATGCYLFLVFGFVSRRCERQADVYGCKAVSCSDPKCAAHSFETPLVAEGQALCPTGVGTFVRALERVEEINGMARDSGQAGRNGVFCRVAGLLRLVGVCLATWQHSTIAKRIEFLKTLAADPQRERRFQYRVMSLRWGLLLVLAVSIAGVVALRGWHALLDGV